MNPFKPYLKRMWGRHWDYCFCPDWDETERAAVARMARKDFVAWANDAGVPAEALLDCEMALGEATSNVVRHSHAVSMRVTVEVGDGYLLLNVLDTGRGFCPAALPLPDDAWTHGRGIPLIRALCEQVTIESRPGRTVVTLVKGWGA